MPYTVALSFDQYRTKTVDLDPVETAIARKSRDYLVEQLGQLPSRDSTFPPLYGGCQYFGSFARKTKVRPLDDIDLLLLLNGKNTSAEFYSGYTYQVRVTDNTCVLWRYTDNGYLNSTKVLNKLKSSLQIIPSYQKAESKRTGEAVTLKLTSYSWVFDIVPAFPVSDGMGGTAYYLISDGDSRWKRTDPRSDQATITAANQHHKNFLIPLIRVMKYWNTNSRAAPRLMSYYFETMLINGLKFQPSLGGIRESIPLAFRQLANQVVLSCPDQKGLGPNLDSDVSWDTKSKVQEAATKRAEYADWALEYERQGNHIEAIKWWGYTLPDFPPYG